MSQVQTKQSTGHSQEGDKVSVPAKGPEFRDSERRINNNVKHLQQNATVNTNSIKYLNEMGYNIELTYDASLTKRADLHGNAALQSKELISVLYETVGLKVPPQLASATVQQLIGHAAGKQSGPWDHSVLEKLYKTTAVLSKSLFDLATKADPSFTEKYDQKIFLAELQKAGFKPGDFHGSCVDQLDGENRKLIIILRALKRAEKTITPPAMTPNVPSLDENPVNGPVLGALNGESTSTPPATSTTTEISGVNAPAKNRMGKSTTKGGPTLAGVLGDCLKGCFGAGGL